MTSKYGNKKCYVDGHKFDSHMECDYYYRLKVLKDKGEILDFKVHPKFMLQPSFKYNGKTISGITYTPDFLVEYPFGVVEIIDVKGAKTNEFKLREKMFKFKYPQYVFKCLTLVGETWVEI